MLAQVPLVEDRVRPYAAAAADCLKTFDQQMDSLYLLALLLTGDTDKGKECFAGGLGEIGSHGLSKEDPCSWAREAIVRYAVQMIRPIPEKGAGKYFASAAPVISGTSNPFAVVVSLSEFERFVFVLSVLEGLSDEECQSLLRCSLQELLRARKIALKLFAADSTVYERNHAAMDVWQGLLN